MNQLTTILQQCLSLFSVILLLSFVATLFWKNKQEKAIARVVLFTKIVYIILAAAFLVAWIGNGAVPVEYRFATLYQTGHFVFAIQFYYDNITAVFSIVGAVLFFLVCTFSRYYMHRDEGFKRFYNTILFFALGYNLIIFSGNFETLFIGWEVIGISSFLLIAFYRNRYLPVKNAFKTLSNYRISDIAIMLAMWMMHHLTHQNIGFTQLSEARTLAETTGHHNMAVFIVIMLVLAAVIKSAQFPFSTWLPRAMEGPTSSSAIFYGSLSVHIGVFILLRTYPFWQDMLWVKILIIAVGVITGFVSTTIAKVQPTVKTQIAYSSSAQIGIIFIEIALGLHILALVHFAGNAFLRTYQLLVSPSMLNYLVHHQYFHYHPPQQRPLSKWRATLYVLGVKEWNLDTVMFKFLWSPFKWIGRKFQFLGTKAVIVFLFVVAINAFAISIIDPSLLTKHFAAWPEVFLSIALAMVLGSFAYRRSAINAWSMLFVAHLFIMAAIGLNDVQIGRIEIIFYASGITAAFLLGCFMLQHTRSVDQDISLNRYHGYVYEQRKTGLLFLIGSIGMLGFPVTAAFVGIDVLFTYVGSGDVLLITLLALCFLFIELAAIRIFLRIYFGLHKKLDHPVAFRTS